MSSGSINWQLGSETDIGGSRENQDDFFIYEKKESNLCIICVLDGHGREVGRAAAMAAKDYLFNHFDKHVSELQTRPYETLVHSFTGAHDYVKNAFKQLLQQQGYEVEEDPTGYLLRRKNGTVSWSCVHGGTSCSLFAIIGDRLYSANVGDSSGILCASAQVLETNQLRHVGDASIVYPTIHPSKSSGGGGLTLPQINSNKGSAIEVISPNANGATAVVGPGPAPSTVTPPPQSSVLLNSSGSVENIISDTLILTAEHSPESISEFTRIRAARPNPLNPKVPEILMLYDVPSHDKSRCPAIFEFAPNGSVVVTGKGKYYKNVRQEWASLVSTPPTAKFQDALAFTRSLGDFHLHSYGVTHLPEVQTIDLTQTFTALVNKQKAEQKPAEPILAIVLASDGVWDNFLYSDVTRFMMDASCINAVKQDPGGAQRVATSFMSRNMNRSRTNFGSQADNATCVVMYITPSATPAFPSSFENLV